MHDTNNSEHHFELEDEFEQVPVPASHRKPVTSVAFVWLGFPLNFFPAVLGGVICAALGFQKALLAIVLASAFMFVYVGTISYFGGQKGYSFALQAQRIFGRWGYLLAVGFLASAVVGWFAFNTGFTGATLHQTFDWNERLATLFCVVSFTVVTIVGVHGLKYIGYIAAPVVVLLTFVALALVADGASFSQIWNYPGIGGSTLSLGAAVTIVIATFADAGTMTGDFTRWSRSGREAVIATAAAFPLGNAFAFASGAVLVGTGNIVQPAVVGGNIIPLLAHGHGWFLAVLAGVCVIVSLGSVCAHCLYNGALGWSHLINVPMRVLVVGFGILAGIAAVAGVWNHLLDWLSFLGVFVPPLGGVIIAAALSGAFSAKEVDQPIATINVRPFVAYAIGGLAGGLVHYEAPEFSEAVVGAVTAALAFAALRLTSTQTTPALTTPDAAV
jgi:cytosine permease